MASLSLPRIPLAAPSAPTRIDGKTPSSGARSEERAPAGLNTASLAAAPLAPTAEPRDLDRTSAAGAVGLESLFPQVKPSGTRRITWGSGAGFLVGFVFGMLLVFTVARFWLGMKQF